MVTQPIGSSLAQGVDVSHYQGTVPWGSFKSAGISFAVAKATEGTGYTDDQFAANKQHTLDSGIYRSGYHFYRPAQDPIVQAKKYRDVAGACELPPALDLEVTDGWADNRILECQPPRRGMRTVQNFETEYGVSPQQIVDGCGQWIYQIIADLKQKPMVYTSAGFWNALGLSPSWVKDVHLWIASWSASPTIPKGWPQGYKFWQYSSSGYIAGINVDQDQFAGTLQDLEAFIQVAPPPPPPPSGDLEIAIRAASLQQEIIPVNDQTALYDAAMRFNWGYPLSDEFSTDFEGKTYIGQVFRDVIGYVIKEDWQNVKSMPRGF